MYKAGDEFVDCFDRSNHIHMKILEVHKEREKKGKTVTTQVHYLMENLKITRELITNKKMYDNLRTFFMSVEQLENLLNRQIIKLKVHDNNDSGSVQEGLGAGGQQDQRQGQADTPGLRSTSFNITLSDGWPDTGESEQEGSGGEETV